MTSMMQEVIQKFVTRQDLSRDEVSGVMEELAYGQARRRKRARS